MSIKRYNTETRQWEAMTTSHASGVKVTDIDGYCVERDDEDNIVSRATDVEGAIRSLGKQISNIKTDFEEHVNNHPGGNGPGGGSGGGSMPTLTILSPEEIIIGIDDVASIEFQFSSPNQGIATAYLELAGPVENKAYEMILTRQGNFTGANAWKLGKLKRGVYNVNMYVIDQGGMYATMNTSCAISVGSLTLESPFISEIDYSVEDEIQLPFKIESVNPDGIEFFWKIDGLDPVKYDGDIGPNVYYTANLGRILSSGPHRITAWAECGVMKSNILIYNILVVDSKGIFVAVTEPKDEYQEGEPVTLYYRASKKGESYVNVYFYINGVENGMVTVPTGEDTLWNLGTALNAGVYEIGLKVRTLDANDHNEVPGINSAEWSKIVTIKAGDFARKQPIIDGSELFIFDASGISGSGATETNPDGTKKYVWKDRGANDIKCELFDFNFNAASGGNGWGNDCLTFSGRSYAVIDCEPLNNPNTTGILNTGFTLEVTFSATNIGNPDAKVLWCRNEKAPDQGFSITPYIATMKAQDGINLSTSYLDSYTAGKFESDGLGNDGTEVENWITISFSIKHGAINAYCYVYVNGVIVRIEPCINNIFKHDGKIYLGAGIMPNGSIGDFANCKIRSVRAYKRQLTVNTTNGHDEVLDNFIADQDIERQEKLWNLNYGKETLPTMYITHPTFFDMSEEDTYLCGIRYNDPVTGNGFNLTDTSGTGEGTCPVKIQGTSSKEYPVKNYTINLMRSGKNFDFSPKENWKAMSQFTLKANYMDSSQANNVSIARFYNDLTKAYNPLPSQSIDSNYRASVDGFPIRLNVNGMFAGIYTFNIDRYGHAAYGFDSSRGDIAYEIASNGDKFVSGKNAEETVKLVSTGFKYRYHYADNGLMTATTVLDAGKKSEQLNMASGLHQDLLKLVNWTADAEGTVFHGDIDSHWSIKNLMDYYICAMVFGMVDSMMKNMVITSYGISDDGEGNFTRIWYPLMYDADKHVSALIVI